MGLSNAERQRRYIARLKAGVTNSELKAGVTNDRLKEEIAKHERTIKGLMTRIQNMASELHIWRTEPKPGRLTPEQRRAIDKALHPDSRDHVSRETRDEAAKAWNVLSRSKR